MPHKMHRTPILFTDAHSGVTEYIVLSSRINGAIIIHRTTTEIIIHDKKAAYKKSLIVPFRVAFLFNLCTMCTIENYSITIEI
jgi:hypothetical protein